MHARLPLCATLPVTLLIALSSWFGDALAAPQGSPPESLPPSSKPPDPGVVQDPIDPVNEQPARPMAVAAPIDPPMYIPPPPPPPPLEPEPEGLAEGDRFELTMGFLVGQRNYSDMSFEFDEGNGSEIGAGQLVEPFTKPPFDGVTVLGLRYDLRVAVSFIRLTAGFDLPFPSYRAADATGRYVISGIDRQLTVQSLSAKELRFGIGGEYPYRSIAPFVDLLGSVHWVSTDFAVDGYKASYSATGFTFSARGGLRVHVRRWFFGVLAGEVGLIGDTRWNAEVSVGFAVK